LVRKRARRFEEEGLSELQDRSRRHIPSLLKLQGKSKLRSGNREKCTGYERKRLSWYPWQEKGPVLFPHMIRHILRRNGYTNRRKRQKAFYPAHWAWEEELPFALVQVDVEDILDKGTPGTKLWDHIRERKLPRYPWTFLEGRTRLRFLARSHELNLINGICFLTLAMFWLRACGIEEVVIL
jgi:hypothetical protein